MHKDKFYSWEDVCITVFIRRVRIIDASLAYVYQFYFSDHMLSEQEIQIAYKNGFWLNSTNKRTEYLLSLYKKDIYGLTKSPTQKKVYKMLLEHNEKVVKL